MRDANKLKERYEVALDGKQIATLAVASLVVLGGVFLLGVVVGKKLTSEGAERAPADLLAQLDRKAAELASLKQQDASLTFQDELTRRSPPNARAAEPPRAEKPAEKREPEKVAAAPAPAVSPPPAAEVPGATDAGAVGVKLAESPRAEAVATRTHDGGGLKEAFGRVQRPPAGTASDGGWTLQLAAYPERTDADRFAAGLRDKGYAPYIVEVTLPARGQWYRVRMGRFPSREAAGRYLEDFRRETSMSAIVTGAD